MAGWRQTSTAAWSKASHALWWGPDVVGALGRFLEKTEEKWTKTSCLARNCFFFLKTVPQNGIFSHEDGMMVLFLNKAWPSSHLCYCRHVDILIYHIGTLNSPQCCWVYDVKSLKKYPIECSNIMDHPPSRSVKSGRRFTFIRCEVNFHLHPKELTNNDIH